MLKIKTDPLLEGAACRSLRPGDEGIFFDPDAEGYLSEGAHKTEVADRQVMAKVRYCAACPVRLHCLQVGLEEEHGVWGGWSPLERRERKRFSPVPRSVTSGTRVNIVRMCQDGESVRSISDKTDLPAKAVRRYLHEWLSLSVR